MSDSESTAAERFAIIVPGILGSALTYATGERHDEIWSANFFANYQLLSSNPSVLEWTGKRAQATLIESASFSLLFPFITRSLWGETLQWLERARTFAPKRVVRYGYDWRASLLETAEHFGRDLGALAGASLVAPRPAGAPPFVFLTHSMGGLLVRIAAGLALLHPSWIDRIVHLGSPLLGSPVAFRTAYGRGGLPFLYELIAAVRGKSRFTYLENLRRSFETFPSLYQLFPPAEVPILYRGPLTPRTNPLDERVMSDTARAYALQAHAALREADRVFDASRTPVHLVYTNNLETARTELEYAVDTAGGAVQRYVVGGVYGSSAAGDGTVPDYSASASRGDVHRYPVAGVEHASLCNSPRVTALLGGIL